MGRRVSYSSLKFAYIIVLLLNRFSLYIPMIHIPSGITPILMLIGIVMIFFDFYYYRTKLAKIYYILIMSFLIIYTVSLISNWDRNVFSDFEGMLTIILHLFCLFMYPMQLSTKIINRQVLCIGIIITILSFICACVSLGHFINQSYFQIGEIPAWGKIYGFIKGRLYGIYIDPNLGAVISCFSISLSFYLMRYRNKNLCYINIVVQIAYLLLSGSRTGLLCFLGSLFIVFFLSRREKFSMYWNRGQAFIKSCLLLFLCIISLNMYEKILVCIPSIKTDFEQYFNPPQDGKTSYIGVPQQNSIGETVTNVSLERDELKSNPTNGRIQLWKDGIAIFFSSPIVGVGKNNIQEVARTLRPSSDLATLNMTTHCGYLELIIAVGLLGFVIMMFFLFLVLKSYLKYIWKLNILTPLDKCIGCIVFTCLVGAMFLAEIFIVNTFISSIFWLFLGYSLSITQQNKYTEGNVQL